ncbi:hypothetical protein COCSADRAFT_159464 [Bipolaris sorokiniana ND90Pr]|uniref:Uncharacterized protein n=1 Tax=Cochliobolus sativus (strain ND90Pr / ATCC 201652) TaxID=665912 RepID=M2TAE0_COCSN|nr:uncharacterized protein COCSADRAFT_159464 [Bipolaris sorokiniana ND90Pr]EMD65877.1 hypothetical protein COCSADRAFT_159464 [Bipolaris sorokiniana ND90Pr]
MAPSNSKDVSFTPREMEVLALAWQCMETQPKIDMAKLGSLAGYTPASASVTFGRIKSKLKLLGESLQDTPGTPGTPSKSMPKKKAATPASTPRKRKNAAPAADATPSKKGKMPMREEDDVEDDDEVIKCDVSGVKEDIEDYGFLSGIEAYAGGGGGGN